MTSPFGIRDYGGNYFRSPRAARASAALTEMIGRLSYGTRIGLIVLSLGTLLRLYLAVANGEANDDHLTVIRIIADGHRLPRLREAWEGFQPKLYHGFVALLWNLSPWQGSIARVRIAQLVSCAAGIATLFVIRRALNRRRASTTVGLLALALVSLNPTLIGLNAQATNDSFVILFGTLAIASGCEFFETGTRRAFLIMTVSTVLAALSKGNGLVIFLATTATLLHAIVTRWEVGGLTRVRLMRMTALFIATVVTAAAALGSYRANWEDTGNPLAINGPRAPLPHLLERTYVYRPGATSVVDTYLTFRLIDMLAHPADTNDPYVYPLHRTSLWSQLYGRAHVVHFAQHPPSWKNTSLLSATVARLILILALLPTTFVLMGMARTSVRIIGVRCCRRRHPSASPTDELLAVTAFAFIAFIVLYTLLYRDFSTMKAEFIFPALLAFLFFFTDETERALEQFKSTVAVRRATRWAYLILLSLYVTDVMILATQLT